MGTQTSHRTRTFRSGLLAAVLGLLLAGFGSTSPAGAERPVVNDHQVAICHATPADANPYTLTFPNKWQIAGPHGHGVDEGDVIPPFAAGSQGANSWEAFPGLNWDEDGEALWNADCAASEDVDPVIDVCDEIDGVQTLLPCEEEESDLCPQEGVQTELPCGPPEDLCPEPGVQAELPCAEEETDLCPEPGVQTELPCEEVQSDLCEDVPGIQTELPCPEDACPEVPGFQANDAACQTELIPPVLIENLPPPAQAPEVVPSAPVRRPIQVAGVQLRPATTVAAQELPRTGVDTGTLVSLGFALVLAGAGIMVAARRPEEATAR